MNTIMPTRRAILAGAAATLAGNIIPFRTQRSAVAQEREPLSRALVMAVDVSSSIDGEHWWLQRKGYADALLHPEVMRAIANTARGRIAVTYFGWAGVGNQRLIVPWSVVATEEDGGGVADVLLD